MREEPTFTPMDVGTLLTAAVKRVPDRLMSRWLNRVHCGDCVEVMNQMPAGSVDLVVAELAQRCIKATNTQVVLDPFIGSGTTAIAAVTCGRNSIGIDIAGGKLRRLVSMEGQRAGNKVRYYKAELFEDMHLTNLAQDLVNGRIAIDFDVREMTPGSKGLRNHGTKFRVSPKNLHRLHHKHQSL